MSNTPKTASAPPEKDLMTETSIKVGKALARTSVKAETSTKKVKKMAEELLDTVTAKTTKKKSDRPQPPMAKKKGALPLSPAPGLSVEGHLGFLAGDIYHHLEAEGQTAVSKLLTALKKRQHTEAMFYAAIGWLAREGQVTFTPDGKDLTLR